MIYREQMLLVKTYIFALTNDNPKFEKLLYSCHYNWPGSRTGHTRYAHRNFIGSSADDPFFGVKEKECIKNCCLYLADAFAVKKIYPNQCGC
jgi:hypothetical protein